MKILKKKIFYVEISVKFWLRESHLEKFLIHESKFLKYVLFFRTSAILEQFYGRLKPIKMFESAHANFLKRNFLSNA